MIIFRSVLLRMRNISDESCTENQNTHFVFVTLFSENRAVCEKIWKNIVESDRPQMTTVIRRMRVRFWISKATNTHPKNITFIALPH